MSAEVSTAIVDASVAIKFVIEEDDSDRALTLGLRHSIIVPAIFWAECANILFKKVKEREIAAEAAPLAWAGLRQFRIATATPTMDLDDATFDLSMRLRHPAYDCAYLALARERQVRSTRPTNACSAFSAGSPCRESMHSR